MSTRKLIQIILADGTPGGVKIVCLNKSDCKAIVIPRNKINEVSDRDDVDTPGVYFLIVDSDDIGKKRVYIGETEKCYSRILQHNTSDKDFWTHAIIFVGISNKINKAHAKYLESVCINTAKRHNRCYLENDKAPAENTMDEMQKVVLQGLFEDILLILGILGFPFLEELRQKKATTLFCKGKKAKAQGEYTDDGFIVFNGSISNMDETPTVSSGTKRIRKYLLEQGVLKKEKDILIFTEDYLFSSPSAASDVVLGRSSNGWTEWKDKNNKTLSDLKRSV